ncbi:MAG: hypothetical protein Q9183_004821 [Haloplaca sp. 2 TL-2023]
MRQQMRRRAVVGRTSSRLAEEYYRLSSPGGNHTKEESQGDAVEHRLTEDLYPQPNREEFQDKLFCLQSLHASCHQMGTALILPEPPKAKEEPGKEKEGEQAWEGALLARKEREASEVVKTLEAWEAIPLQPHTTQFHVAVIRYMAELMICEDFSPNLAEAFDATTQDLAEAQRMIYKDADGILDLRRIPGGPWYHKDIGGNPGLDLHER